MILPRNRVPRLVARRLSGSVGGVKAIIGSIALVLCTLATGNLRALDIRIDYSLDTGNFFNTAEKRAALQAVADFYGELLTDTLLGIDASQFNQASWTLRFNHPSTGDLIELPGPVIPENVIIVYAGSRDLSGSTTGRGGPGGFGAQGFSDWFERIRGRGSPGAAASPSDQRTDFALWGGAITFDTMDGDSPRLWNFSLTENGPGTEFVATALHEFGHLLGIGTADTWTRLANLFVGSPGTPGVFSGAAVEQSLGFQPNVDNAHFQGGINSTAFASFAQAHGTQLQALMLPSRLDDGSVFNVVTDVDLAALVDIGWELAPDPQLRIFPAGNGIALDWNGVSFKQYDVLAGTDPAVITGVASSSQGDGQVATYVEASPQADSRFYRLAVSQSVPSSQATAGVATRAFSTAVTEMPLVDAPATFVHDPVEVECAH